MKTRSVKPDGLSSRSRRSKIELEQSLEQAFAYHQQGKFDEAIALCDAILAKQPDHLGAMNILAATHVKREDHGLALNLMEQALRVDAHSLLAWNCHGNALRGLNRFEDALQSYSRTIAIEPDFAPGFFNIAGVMEMLGRRGEALSMYDRAIAIASELSTIAP